MIRIVPYPGFSQFAVMASGALDVDIRQDTETVADVCNSCRITQVDTGHK